MDWMNQLSGILQQYTGTAATPARSDVHDDFDQIANSAPPSALADGLAAAFRSDQTPEFGQMAAQLFTNSSGQQRAGILNTLIRAAGPMIVSQILSAQGRLWRRLVKFDRSFNWWAASGGHAGASGTNSSGSSARDSSSSGKEGPFRD